MTEADVEAIRDRYIAVLSPLFLPDPSEAVSRDIVRYFASLLRIVGMEDGGWDPHLESRALLEDLNAFMQLELPKSKFPDADATVWRVALLFYSHIVEMDAPYEVLANLLRFRLGKGYSPNPFFMFLSDKEKKAKGNRRLGPKRKIELLRQLGDEAGVAVASLFDEFYDSELRNAIAHSDFILTDETFRSRGGPGGFRAFSVPLMRVNELITKAKVFVGTFLGLDVEARRLWGSHTGRGIPYDPVYKGLMEILVDREGLLCGFKIHWPNNSESIYRRTPERVQMTNCMLDLKNSNIEFMVGLYARQPGQFSPLVEAGMPPVYTPLDGAAGVPSWA